jgi:hypothetical protein
LAAAFAAIALLCDRRGSALAAVSSVVAAGACVCGIAVNSLVSLNLAGATRSGAAPPGTDTLLVSVNTGPTPTAILATYIGGLCAASVLMAVALWRARAARWLAVLFPICLVGGSVSPPGPVGVLMSLPIATVMVLLGRKLWKPAEPARPTAHHTVLNA